jgi:RHS repeat-associated protein
LTTDRGYTLHEHLDEMGTIHMNGRVYDPLTGRFMSADPIVQAPGNLQSYNRYAYVMNNPLNLTDPSGYSWWTRIRGTVVRAIAAVADGVTGCLGCFTSAVGAYQGYQNGGGWRGALVGGVTSYFGAQYAGDFSATGFAVSAASGCASAAVSGGNCGRGALGGTLNHFGSDHGFTGQALAGCVSARINGGSCGQGARNAVESRFISNAVSHLVAGVRGLLEEDKSPAHTGRHSFAPAIAACALSFPCSTAVIGVSFRVAAILARGSGVFSVNNADNPEATNGVDNAKGADSSGTKPQKPDGVPEGWIAEPGKKDGNTKWVNPDNPHDYVRVKPDGSISQVRDGKAYDVNGNRVDLKSPSAHGIRSDDFTFRP